MPPEDAVTPETATLDAIMHFFSDGCPLGMPRSAHSWGQRLSWFTETAQFRGAWPG